MGERLTLGMARRETAVREREIQRALGQLYTLAYYAYGDDAAAQEALGDVMDVFRRQPVMDVERFLLFGMKRIYGRGMALDCHAGLPCGDPGTDQTLRFLSGLGFEERMTLLLHGRHGMPAELIAQVTGSDEDHVRQVLLTASLGFRVCQ